MKVLVVKTSSLGDVIHTLPALSDAATAIPGIQFDWVVEEKFAEVPAWHPAVNKVIPVALRRWRKHIFSVWLSDEWKAFKQVLHSESYDCVIDAQGLIKSAFLTRYVSAPVHGLDKRSAREPFSSRFYSHKHVVSREQHAVERVRQLFSKALGYTLPSSVGVFNLKRSSFSDDQLPDIVRKQGGKPALVFLHGTTWKDKHWPVDYWCDLVTMAEKADFTVYLPWGNENEKLRAERISKAGKSTFVLPRLNLASIAAVISRVKGVVAVDSGLGHLTAALDVPAVSLYGPTSPDRVGTYGMGQMHLTLEDGDVSCSRDVSPEIFRPLTAECVWTRFSPVLAASRSVSIENNSVSFTQDEG